MAAEVQPRRTVSLEKIREWLTLGSAVVLVLGGLLGGMRRKSGRSMGAWTRWTDAWIGWMGAWTG